VSVPLRLGTLVRRAIACAGLACVLAGRLLAQTAVELQGGGSSLYQGYGVAANVFGARYDGWVGLSYVHGLRAGAFMRAPLGEDTLRLGNDALLLRFPTDLFGTGTSVPVQGASYTMVRPRFSVTTFGGATASGRNSAFFSALKADKPFGAVLLTHRPSDRLTFTSSALVAGTNSYAQAAEWRASNALTAAVTGAVTDGRSYGASSVLLRLSRLELRAAYVLSRVGYRRVDADVPTYAEPDRENVLLTVQPLDGFTVSLGRQNFVQDTSAAAPATHATGNSLSLGGQLRRTRLSAGVYDSRAETARSLSWYAAAGRPVFSWLDAELFVLQNRPRGGDVSTTPVMNLRERLSPRLGLVQQITLVDRRPHLQLGGSFVTSVGEFGVDYQLVRQPFQPLSPFRSTVALTARLQIGRYSTSIGTVVKPDGAVDYQASGSTFLYLGDFGGAQPQLIGTGARLERFVLRGHVEDENGAPVEGAAIELDGEVAYTDSQGNFLVRAPRPKRYALQVRLEDFLLPGTWAVIDAPVQAQAGCEGRDLPVHIRLRRVVPLPPARDSAAAAPAPDAPPSADTLHAIAPLPPLPPVPAEFVTIPTAPPVDLARIAPPPAARPLFAPGETRRRLDGVNFLTDRAVMLPEAFPVLDSLATEMLAAPAERIEIEGHTDGSGSAARNLVLSRARAASVREYLARRGVERSRMIPRGYGAARPVATNATAAGRADNRRVEIRRLQAARPAAKRAPARQKRSATSSRSASPRRLHR
jgi:outer membrane protein OmpA-like peptidoglycan-associated protein